MAFNTSSRRAMSFFIVSMINFYFPFSYLFRSGMDIVYSHMSIPRLSNEPLAIIDYLIFISCFIVIFAFVLIHPNKENVRCFNGRSSKFIVSFSVIIYIAVLLFFKVIGFGYTYEGFHLLINSSPIGKLQYVLYLSLSVQLYYVIKFNNKFLVSALFLQLIISVFISNTRSFLLIQIITISLLPMVTGFILKNKIKAFVAIALCMLAPVFLRGGGDILFVLSQIFSTGAYQYDLLVLSLNHEVLKVSTDYINSGGGYGSLLPRDLFVAFGVCGIFAWAISPLLLLFIPIPISCSLAAYYFIIVRNDFSSWVNGYISIVVFISGMYFLSYFSSKHKMNIRSV